MARPRFEEIVAVLEFLLQARGAAKVAPEGTGLGAREPAYIMRHAPASHMVTEQLAGYSDMGIENLPSSFVPGLVKTNSVNNGDYRVVGK